MIANENSQEEDEKEEEYSDHQVNWDLKSFLPNSKLKELIVDYGDKILFTSKDNKTHDISFADRNWKILARIVPPKKNMKETIVVTPKIFRTPATYHLVSSENSNRLRLRIRIPEKRSNSHYQPKDDSSHYKDGKKRVNDVFDGITHGEYTNQKKDKHIPGSRVSHVIRVDKNQIEKMTSRKSEHDSADGIIDGLTDNGSESNDFRVIPKKTNPKRTTFAQRRNARKTEDTGDMDLNSFREKGSDVNSVTTEIIDGATVAQIQDQRNIDISFTDEDLNKIQEMTEELRKRLSDEFQ